MSETYFQAARSGRRSDPSQLLADVQMLRVSVSTGNPDQFDDDEVEAREFDADAFGEAADWLIRRGCQAHEAARIVDSGWKHMLAQSTGTGPTEIDAILDIPDSEVP